MSRLAAVFCLLGASVAGAAEPRVSQLRMQRTGARTYFQVSFEVAPEIRLPEIDLRTDGPLPAEGLRRQLARLPRLVALDGKTRAVCYRPPRFLWGQQVSSVEFVGIIQEQGAARFLLLRPAEKKAELRQRSLLPPALHEQAWDETALTLDFSKARRMEAFPAKQVRDPSSYPESLEGLWAEAQAHRFAVLEAQAPDSGFYSFARETVGRKYHVPTRPFRKTEAGSPRQAGRRLYEMTTGAASLAEALAQRRLLKPDSSRRPTRFFKIADVAGVEMAEHPWKAMRGSKKPAAEPLARLVPHDNYYVAFKSLTKFLEVLELSEQWGATLVQACEINSREYGLRQRYEKQLCLKSTALAKTLGPALLHGLVVTGSDWYLREGSDVSVIFQVKQRGLFLAAVEPFIEEAHKEYGKQLKHERTRYRDVTVESFVTPLREISLHRAAFGDCVVYSNSAAALRRILDTHAGRRKPLADALDFQYMRTVFRGDDKDEDGFIFLPDAFIRQLVGPASKIKEKRRLEALASLYTLTNAALFTAWETGKLPGDHKDLLAAARLGAQVAEVPEGNSARWDTERQVAVADAYGTIHFATPLIETPIEELTGEEWVEYHEFRRHYSEKWRQYVDPAGMRLRLKDGQVRMEVYLLPLVGSNEYRALRRWTGGDTVLFDPKTIPPETLLQYTMRLAPQPFYLGSAVGDLLFLRLSDGPVYRRWAEALVRQELLGDRGTFSMRRLLCETPLTLGVRIGDAREFAERLRGFEHFLSTYGGSVKAVKPAYRGITVRCVRFAPEGRLADSINGSDIPIKERVTPVLFHATVDDVWYVSTDPEVLHRTIDRALARRQDKKLAKEEGVPINSSVHVAPGAAGKAASAVHAYLEWESHRRALANEPLWYALYHSGVLARDAAPETARVVARRFFGFVPVSPDGEAYRYDNRMDEVVNSRHGSLRQPRLHADLAPAAPLAKLLEQLRAVRADLRFRENGIHTVLTIQRKPPRK